MKRARQQQQTPISTPPPQQMTTPIKKRRIDIPMIGFSHGLQEAMTPIVHRLLHACFSKELLKTGSKIQDSLAYLKHTSNLLCWVSVRDENNQSRIVAFCNYVRRNGRLHNGETTDDLITDVCTDPGAQKKGYMTFLLSYIIVEKLFQRKTTTTAYPILHLEVLRENQPAIRLYQKLGFGVVSGYGPWLLMSLEARFDHLFMFPLSPHVVFPNMDGLYKIKDSVVSNDCALRALALLGSLAPNEPLTTQLMQHLKKNYGTPDEYTANILSMKTNNLITFQRVNTISEITETLRSLSPGTVAPLSFYWSEPSAPSGMAGHITIVGRTTTGRLFCYEDQLGELLLGEPLVHHHVITNKQEWHVFRVLSNWNIHDIRLQKLSGPLRCRPVQKKQPIFQKISPEDDLVARFRRLSIME